MGIAAQGSISKLSSTEEQTKDLEDLGYLADALPLLFTHTLGAQGQRTNVENVGGSRQL